MKPDVALLAALALVAMSLGVGTAPAPLALETGSSQDLFAQVIPSVSIAPETGSVEEAGAPCTGGVGPETIITFRRSGATSQPLTVRYSLSGNAVHGIHYSLEGHGTGSEGTVVFAANAAEKTVAAEALRDANSANEEFTVTIEPAGQAEGFGYLVNPTARTSTITVKDDAPTQPSPPSLVAKTHESIRLQWTAQAGLVYTLLHGPKDFAPSAGTVLTTVSATGVVEFVHSSLQPNTEYYYRLQAKHSCYSSEVTSAQATFKTNVFTDTVGPFPPPQLAVTIEGSANELTWGVPADRPVEAPGAVESYSVYVGDTSSFTPSSSNRETSGLEQTSFSHASGGTKCYKVTATDDSGNEGSPTDAVCADRTDPTPATNLQLAVSGDSLFLTWDAGSDESGAVRYEIHHGSSASFTTGPGSLLATVDGLTYNHAGAATGTHCYRVIAVDGAGNKAPATPTVCRDGTPPSQVTGLTATGGPNAANAAWQAATDDTGVDHYEVHRSTTKGFTPGSSTLVASPQSTSFTGSGLTPGTEYCYRVRAVDGAGNLGQFSDEKCATPTQPPETTPPTAPTNLQVTAESTSVVKLAWTAATDNVGVDHYTIERGPTSTNFVIIFQSTTTTFTDEGRTAQTQYCYRVRAVDAAGNQGPPTAASCVTTPAPPDTIAPGFVSGLSVTAVGDDVTLTWLESPEDDIDKYQVARAATGGFEGAQIVDVTGTSHTFEDLAPGDHYFRIRALDTSGNIGPWSLGLQVTIDAQPEAQPDPPVVSQDGTGLTWATDDDKTYDVQCTDTGDFADAQSHTPGDGEFDAAGLEPGTYQCRVRAVTADGTTSDWSQPSTITVEPEPADELPAILSEWSFWVGLALVLGCLSVLGVSIARVSRPSAD